MIVDPDALIAAACEQTGLDDLGEPSYREGLDRLADGLEHEARLNDIGRAVAGPGLLPYLVNRLQIVDWHRRHPEVAEGRIRPPVVLIGMGRTGTTILHDILGQDPASRIPLTWQVDRPVPPPQAATADRDPRIAEVQAGIDAIYAGRPQMQAMHPMGALLGQECIRVTGSEFASAIFLSQYHLPSYLRWVTSEADMAPAYRWHRRYLQVLQSERPAERWVLKSGAHQWALPALVAEYPDAVFVQTHRDPLRIVASMASLFHAIWSASSDASTPPIVASTWAEPTLDGLDRTVAARRSGLIPDDRVVDIHFGDFMADPIAVVRRVYDLIGTELSPEVESRMSAFLARHPRNQHGLHRYTFADTGLDEGELRARAKTYQDYFDVPSEPV